MVSNVFLFDLLATLALAIDLSAALLHMSHIVFVLDLDLARRSRRTIQKYLIENHPGIAVQGLHM